MAAKNFMECFKSGSNIDISETESGILREVSDDGTTNIEKITALKDGIDLECAELIECEDDGTYLDGSSLTDLTSKTSGSNGIIVCTSDHKIYCHQFIEE